VRQIRKGGLVYRISKRWASANRGVSLLIGTVLRVFPYKCNYSCEEVPVALFVVFAMP